MRDVELYRHLSPPNIHWTIGNCGQVHCQSGFSNLSEFSNTLMSRYSISNLIQVIDRKTVDNISSLWINLVLTFSGTSGRDVLILRIQRALKKTTIHYQLAMQQSYFVGILPGFARIPLNRPIFRSYGSHQASAEPIGNCIFVVPTIHEDRQVR